MAGGMARLCTGWAASHLCGSGGGVAGCVVVVVAVVVVVVGVGGGGGDGGGGVLVGGVAVHAVAVSGSNMWTPAAPKRRRVPVGPTRTPSL